MKAKELAEQLLKNPDFDVEFDVCTDYPTYEYPWETYKSYKVNGIDGIAYDSKVIVLEVEEITDEL